MEINKSFPEFGIHKCQALAQRSLLTILNQTYVCLRYLMLHTDNNDRIEKKQVRVYTKKGLILTHTRQQAKNKDYSPFYPMLRDLSVNKLKFLRIDRLVKV